MVRLELLGFKPEEICEELHIGEATYWRRRAIREQTTQRQFLVQQWRLITEWYDRQRNIYKKMAVEYAKSLEGENAQPKSYLLKDMAKLENSVLDRLIEMKLVPSKDTIFQIAPANPLKGFSDEVRALILAKRKGGSPEVSSG